MERHTCSWIRRPNIVNNSSTESMQSIKIPAAFCAEIDMPILKFIWKVKEPTKAKTILRKNKIKGLTLPYFKTYYKTRVIQTMWHWQKTTHIDQCNRLESSEIHPYGQINWFFFLVLYLWLKITQNLPS